MQGVNGETVTEVTSPPAPPPVHVSPDPYRDSPVTMGTPLLPLLGTVIPNRLFVGRIDLATTESEIWHFFSQHGVVKEVNIVLNHLGMSKGYGFVTFETEEDVQRIIHAAADLCFQSKRLAVGLAIRRQHRGQRSSCLERLRNPSMTPPCSTLHLTTANGCNYTYHNGVAYFHSQDTPSPVHHCPVVSGPPPVVFPQQPEAAVYQQPACQHFQHQFVEHMVHPAYHQMYTQSPTPVWPRNEYGKVGYTLP